MNYIVLDLEWNQPIDGQRAENRELPFEIIEIGAIMLNSDRKIIGEYTQLIKPTVYHVMNEITGKLINLKMNELKKGRPFPEVITEFLEWCGDDYMFCTWGSQDLTELQRNMNYYGIEPLADKPFPYLDIQKLFSIAFEDKKIRRSLEFAAAYLQLKQDIPFHRAFSDAYYTAKIMEAIDDENVFSNLSYDTYHLPKNRREEIHVLFSDYAKYISKGFPDKEKAMLDKEVISTRCFMCGDRLPKRIRWFSANSKHFYSVSYCELHGYMKGKIRLKHSDDGQIYVVKTQKFITIEEMGQISAKRTHLRDLRRQKRQNMKDN